MQSGAHSTRNWCDERLADPADDLYFAVLFSPHEMRPTVRAAAALFIELEAIATRFRDLTIARTKLAWWRDELERLDAGSPGHPVTKILAQGNADTSHLLLADLVTGMELILLEDPVTDLATAQMRAERGLARLMVAFAQLFGNASAPAGDYTPLGTAVGLTRLLHADGLDREARQHISAEVGKLLAAESRMIVAAPAPLRVLAALAWRKNADRTSSISAQRHDPRRVFAAWQAARGRLPRNMIRNVT
ncbi:MAG: squalene/phytoene synthase family protein [Gammaproteobacteria bacterium]